MKPHGYIPIRHVDWFMICGLMFAPIAYLQHLL